MKISLNTEIEEIAELRHAIAIIEDAIKRREAPEEEEESYEETPEEENYEETPEEEQQQEPQIQREEPSQQAEPIQQPQRETPPEVDISKLSMSDYGERVENRTMEGNRPEETLAPKPQKDNKTTVKEIIQSLKERSQGRPIRMQEIVDLTRMKNISEEETRRLVSELQRSGSI